MIWTLITVALIIIGIMLLVVNNTCNNLLLFGLGVTSLGVGMIIGFIIGTIAIINLTAVDKSIYEAEMQYESLTKQLQTIDSEYEDVSKAEVIQKVYDWNTKVYKSKYWTESPWTNWLCSENIFGIYTKKDTAEAAKDLIIKELYEKEIARGWMTIVEDISDIEVEILEIDADEIVNIELGGYCE